ncbi:MAG: protein phosphatase 2C domain-containing protein [Ferruginibacter sp.]
MGDNFFGITDPGRLRTNNEDSFIAQAVFDGGFIMACVIDGVGGYAGGDLAAKITRDSIIHRMNKLPDNIIDRMLNAFEYANEKIFKEKERNKEHEKMACVVTLAIVDIEKNKFYYAHVGDTRLYLFRDNSLVKITNDHSTVGFLEESGRLTEAAAMAHPKRNEVNKALGYETQIGLTKGFIDTGESPFLPGDTILLCSDGLTDMISTSEIIDILNTNESLAGKGKQLIDAANEAGGKDNITAVLVHNHKSPAQFVVTKPVTVARQKIDEEKLVQLDNGDNAGDSAVLLTVPEVKKKRSPFFTILGLLCLLFLAGFIWYFLKDLRYNEPKLLMPPPAKKERSMQERNLIDSINASRTTVVSLNAGQQLFLTDYIFIRNDTLHLKGNGVTLVSDSSYKGPAFTLASGCKYILLDSLILENFDVGVLVMNKGLHLKNVEFKNCRVPIELEYQLPPNKRVSGTTADTLFHHKDSVAK